MTTHDSQRTGRRHHIFRLLRSRPPSMAFAGMTPATAVLAVLTSFCGAGDGRHVLRDHARRGSELAHAWPVESSRRARRRQDLLRRGQHVLLLALPPWPDDSGAVGLAGRHSHQSYSSSSFSCSAPGCLAAPVDWSSASPGSVVAMLVFEVALAVWLITKGVAAQAPAQSDMTFSPV